MLSVLCRTVLAAAAVALLACSCSVGGGAPQRPPLVLPTGGSVPTTTPLAPTTTPPPPSTPAPTPRKPAPPPPPSSFLSPSGNIRCALAGPTARCDIIKRTYKPGPIPASCQGSYGSSVYANAKVAGFGCVSDFVPAGPVLPYGQTTTYNGTRCTSARDAMTCTTAAGHGFVLSRGRATFR